MWMSIAPLFLRAKKVETAQCPSPSEQMNTGWYIRTGEYYSAIQKNESLMCNTTWMKLEDIMLCERS